MVRTSGVLSIIGVALLVGACIGSGATPPPTSGGGGPAGGGGGAGAGSLNACNLLSAADIQSAVGWAVSTGTLQNTDGQTDCEWAGATDDTKAVGLTIADFDQVLWDAGANAGNSTAVSGIGDAAFKGWPHPGDLTIKVKGYEVSVAVIDFSVATAQEDQAALALANIVLPKL